MKQIKQFFLESVSSTLSPPETHIFLINSLLITNEGISGTFLPLAKVFKLYVLALLQVLLLTYYDTRFSTMDQIRKFIR